MEDCLRVLHVTGGLNMGGIENFLINIYRNIDRSKIQFDFLIHSTEQQFFEKEILNLGGKIYRISSLKKVGYILYKRELKEFFKNHTEYNIIHSHYNEVSGMILEACDNNKYRIAHSHAAYPKYSNIFIKLFAKYLIIKLNSNCTYRFACSREAGKWLYGKNKEFEVLKNGIEVKRFLFNKNFREKIRKELNILENEIALVNVARLSYQKNHKFILEIMERLNQKSLSYKLFLIGNGELEKELKELAKKKKIKNVFFLGIRENINEILNAMDIMIFPSFSEGLGITAIEAQSNGIPVLASQFVPKEADMGLNLFKQLKILNTDKWIEEILKLKNIKRENQTREQIEKILNSDYNIEKTVKILEKFYLGLE